MDKKLSAPVSRVDRPAPTTNIEPQKPPNEALSPDGQKRRHPTVRVASPVATSVIVPEPALHYIPIMKVTRNP